MRQLYVVIGDMSFIYSQLHILCRVTAEFTIIFTNMSQKVEMGSFIPELEAGGSGLSFSPLLFLFSKRPEKPFILRIHHDYS